MSSINKIADLVSPRMSPNIKQLSPFLNAVYVKSCPKTLSASFQSNIMNKHKQFLSPNWSCVMQDNAKSHSTKPIQISETVQWNRVNRCLFSPRKPSNGQRENYYFSNTRKDEKAVLFDTPHRKRFSSLQINKNIKKFKLGEGSFGVVIKGNYKKENIAVKIILNKNGDVTSEMMKSETNAVGLFHPNIVQVYQVIRHSSNTVFVLMELYDHTTLEHLLQNEILPNKVKLKCLIQTASALKYCHDNKILHLDVKPKNILVCSSDITCKLCDFGNSRSIAVETESHIPSQGTLKYSAPELLKGGIATEKADIYSFGITMWQTFHQEVPYENEDIHVVIYKVVTQNYRPRCRQTKSSFENQHSMLYRECWAAEPYKRPPMTSVIERLKETECYFLQK